MIKYHLENWWSSLCGIGVGGITTTLLSINLQQIFGVLSYVVLAFVGGFVGFVAKKVAEICWNKVFKK